MASLKSARQGQHGKIPRPRAARGRGPQIPEVALLLETSTEYGRGLLRGILKYVSLHGPWSLSVAPGHLDQSLSTAASWKGTGIIARVRTPEMAKWVRSTRLPLVVSSLLESQPFTLNGRCGEIRTDSEAIARMGAKHLLDAGLRRFAFCGFAHHQWSAAREQVFTSVVREAGYECS